MFANKMKKKSVAQNENHFVAYLPSRFWPTMLSRVKSYAVSTAI